MSNITFGQLDSWDNEGGGKRVSKEDFAQTKADGKYVYRFLTEPPYKYSSHWIDLPNGRRIKVNCAAKDCILCKQGVDVQTKYVSRVLNRDIGRPQLYEFGKQIFDGLKLLFNNKKHWGSLANFDVEIDKKMSRKPEVYRITPLPKEPLSQEDLAMIAEFSERVSIDKHCASMSNEDIEKRIAQASATDGFGSNGGGGNGFGGGNHTFVPKASSHSTASNGQSGAAMAAASLTSTAAIEEDPDFSFT